MKKYLIILILLALTACAQNEPAPATAIPPTETLAPTATQVPTETLTPSPTPTPEPYKIENGSLLDFNEETGEYILAGEGVAYITTTASGDIIAVDSGDHMVMKYENGNWVVARNRYTSCAAPELVAEVVSDFEVNTSKTVLEMINYQMTNGYYEDTVAFGGGLDLYSSDGVYVGYRTISLEGADGAISGDKVLCMYMGQSSTKGGVAPLVAAFTYKGKYYQTHHIMDSRDSYSAHGIRDFGLRPENWDYENMDQLESLISQIQLGDSFYINTPTFAGINSLDDFDKIDKGSELWFKDNIELLLRVLSYDDDSIARLRGEKSPFQVMEGLNPRIDIGLFMHSLYWAGQK